MSFPSARTLLEFHHGTIFKHDCWQSRFTLQRLSRKYIKKNNTYFWSCTAKCLKNDEKNGFSLELFSKTWLLSQRKKWILKEAKMKKARGAAVKETNWYVWNKESLQRKSIAKFFSFFCVWKIMLVEIIKSAWKKNVLSKYVENIFFSIIIEIFSSPRVHSNVNFGLFSPVFT